MRAAVAASLGYSFRSFCAVEPIVQLGIATILERFLEPLTVARGQSKEHAAQCRVFLCRRRRFARRQSASLGRCGQLCFRESGAAPSLKALGPEPTYSALRTAPVRPDQGSAFYKDSCFCRGRSPWSLAVPFLSPVSGVGLDLDLPHRQRSQLDARKSTRLPLRPQPPISLIDSTIL